jgi:hypothetical protein
MGRRKKTDSDNTQNFSEDTQNLPTSEEGILPVTEESIEDVLEKAQEHTSEEVVSEYVPEKVKIPEPEKEELHVFKKDIYAEFCIGINNKAPFIKSVVPKRNILIIVDELTSDQKSNLVEELGRILVREGVKTHFIELNSLSSARGVATLTKEIAGARCIVFNDTELAIKYGKQINPLRRCILFGKSGTGPFMTESNLFKVSRIVDNS